MFSGSVFSRETYLRVGGFSTRRKNEDWELWIRMVRAGCRVVGAPTPTLLYRQHANSLSAADGTLAEDIAMYEELMLTAQGEERDAIERALRRRHARSEMLAGLDAIGEGSVGDGRRRLLSAIRLDPSLRGGRSSRAGSVALRAAAALAAPRWAAKQRQARNTDPEAIRTKG